MTDVHVLGTGAIPFRKYPEKTLADLGWPALREAILEANVKSADINAVYCGTALGGMLAGQRVTKMLGMSGMPIINVENACSSSSSALAQGWMAIKSGKFDLVAVIGVEKLTKFGGGTLPLEKEDWEVNQGLVMPALYAMRANRYMHEYGLTHSQLAQVSVKAHDHGALNPNAQIRKQVTLEEVMSARPVADPFTLWHCCPTGDGAAALILASSEVAKRYRSDTVRILASEVTSGKYTNGYRDMTFPELTARGAHEAYEIAGLAPDDVGGLLSRGHPVGATGAVQAVEVVRQIEGRAGAHQVANAKVGLTHATGGGVAGYDHGACSIHVFAR